MTQFNRFLADGDHIADYILFTRIVVNTDATLYHQRSQSPHVRHMRLSTMEYKQLRQRPL